MLAREGLGVAVFSTYVAVVGMLPIAGGWVADRLLGARRTVMIGAVLMSAGHLVMSFYPSFLGALVLLLRLVLGRRNTRQRVALPAVLGGFGHSPLAFLRHAPLVLALTGVPLFLLASQVENWALFATAEGAVEFHSGTKARTYVSVVPPTKH